ncbi:unnamed protein product [Gadus morhua 'NCC']
MVISPRHVRHIRLRLFFFFCERSTINLTEGTEAGESARPTFYTFTLREKFEYLTSIAICHSVESDDLSPERGWDFVCD